MGEWKTVELGIITDVRDGTHDSPKQVNLGKPLVTSRHIKHGKIDFKNAYHISFDDFEAVNKRSKVDKYDILFSMIGTVGEMALIDFEPDFAIKNVGLFKTNKNKELATWILYYLKSKDAQAEIDACMKGSTQQYITLGDLRKFPIVLPPLPEQKAIASVLSSLDDKIDLLHRQNKTLEQMAETLFRQWFVVDADEGWEYDELKDYVIVVDNRGKTPPNSKEKTNYPLIEVNALGKENRLIDYSVIKKYVEKETFNNWFRNNPKKYDTLLSTVGTIGAISMYILEVGNIAQNVIGLTAKGISSFYLYQFLKYRINEILLLDIGGVQPSIKVPHLLSLVMPIPPINLQKNFDDKVLGFVSKMEINYNQIRTLEKMRDALLPKLMSGEVKVEI